MLFVLGTPPGVTECGHGFPYVLYQLWLVGVAARHLEVLIRRRRTRVTWWWPCCVESKDSSSYDVCEWFMNCMYMFYTVSSPYLLVFADDRVLRYK